MALVRRIEEALIPRFAQYTLSTTPTPLSDATILGSAQAPKKLTVMNSTDAANNVFLGGSTVANTPANAGIELAPGASYTFEYKSPAHIFIVGTVDAANIAFVVAEYA